MDHSRWDAALKLLQLERDAVGVTVLWATWRRGSDVMRAQWEGLYRDHSGELASDYWSAADGGGELPPLLLLCPTASKTAYTRRPETLEIRRLSDRPDAACAVTRLRRYHSALLAAGLSARGFIFRPLSFRSVTTGPAISAITSSALANRFKRALEAAEMHEGETVHGTRRGAMQEAERGGMARADVWSRAGIKTPNVGAMYLDQGRHLAVRKLG